VALISLRAQELEESATLAVSAKAAKMQSEGIDVVSFGAGEPDFDTPDHIKQAACEAIKKGMTKYAKPASGIMPAKEAVCESLKKMNDLDYKPGQVLITVGGKEALYLAIMALMDPGDECIIPIPYWVSYPEMVKLAQGKSVFIEGKEQNEFKLTPDEIAARITPRTKLFVFNSPSNPGGFSYTPAETRAIADMLMDHPRVIILSDEMYDRLLFTGQKYLSFAGTRKEMYDRTLTFNAGSKTYSMTGWRIGYVAGPLPIIQNMAKIQSQTTSGTATFCQQALAVALRSDQACVEQMRQEFARRAEHMWKRLNAIPGVRCVRPTGAFYAFPNVSGAFKKLGVTNSLDFASKVLEQAHVALVPGSAFGADNYVRLSFATSMAQIDKGLDRLQKLLS